MCPGRMLTSAHLSPIFNAAFSAYHIAFGIANRSWWLFTIGVYYVLLSAVRFFVLRSKAEERFIIRLAGIVLMVLSLPLVGTVILSFVKDRGTKHHLIVMLAIAVYAFTKITVASIRWAKARNSTEAKRIALRNISFANAFVSIFALQRSMLVTFEGMAETEIRTMNAATGSAVCVIVFLLGFHLVYKKAAAGKTEQ